MRPQKVQFQAVAIDAVPADRARSGKNEIKVVTGLGQLGVKCPVGDDAAFHAILSTLQQVGATVPVAVEAFVEGQTNATKIEGDAIAFGRMMLKLIDAQPVREKASA